MTIDLAELKANALKLKSGACPIEDYCVEHDEVLALIEVAEAAQDSISVPLTHAHWYTARIRLKAARSRRPPHEHSDLPHPPSVGQRPRA